MLLLCACRMTKHKHPYQTSQGRPPHLHGSNVIDAATLAAAVCCFCGNNTVEKARHWPSDAWQVVRYEDTQQQPALQGHAVMCWAGTACLAEHVLGLCLHDAPTVSLAASSYPK